VAELVDSPELAHSAAELADPLGLRDLLCLPDLL
jgi:hypothetical protein